MPSLERGRGGVNAARRGPYAACLPEGERFLAYNFAMAILVCGSLAYDTIMVFPDHFRKHILPDQIHILNVSFMVPQMRREFGGCAGNIAYNLKLLGEYRSAWPPWATIRALCGAPEVRSGSRRATCRDAGPVHGAGFHHPTDIDDNQSPPSIPAPWPSRT